MEFTVTCKCEANSIEELAAKLAQIEGNRRSRSHVQSVVGPPDAAISRGESGRWPDRLTIPRLIGFIKDDIDKPKRQGLSATYNGAWNACCEYFVQQLEELDKGGVEMAGQDAPE